MKIEQIYTSCIAEAAYYIESDGEVAIIDPLRETEPYLNRAEQDNAKIKYIFETHFHADFVSGHVDLAGKTGAKIIYGPTAEAGFDIIVAEDGQEFRIGKVKIKVLHTPGHTMESSSYLLIDENGKNHALFSGDTLFLGDVGRPDLAVKTDLTQEQLAGHLFDSLRNKIMNLEEDIIVYPAHGAGSSCGKNLSDKTVDTLGNQLKTNYALRADMSKGEFVTEVLDGILPPPQYFPKNAMMNKNGYDNIDDVMKRGSRPLLAEEFESKMNQGALVLDVRNKEDFRKGHISGSMFIGLDGNFAMWVGALIKDLNTEIIFIAPEDRVEETVKRLARVGYDHAIGFLSGGIEAWVKAGKEIESVESVNTTELSALMKEDDINITDVRKRSEYDAEHIEDALSFPLDFLSDNAEELDKSKKYYVHCKSGYRSLVAISMLKKAGYNHLVDIEGGMDAILKSQIPVTDFVCQE